MDVLIDQLKGLKLHGMAQTASDLLAIKKASSITTCLQQLIDAESTAREIRAILYQITIG